jgi:4'-phosphopantetheinyl transferase
MTFDRAEMMNTGVRRPGVPWERAEHRPRAVLSAGDVHLWRAPLNVDADMLAGLSRALSREEHERADRFHFERDRVRWMAARGWMRQLLAGYLGADAAELCFERQALGKLRLAAPAQWLRFNLSHSADIAAVAVAHSREVGVDVERVCDDSPTDPVPSRYLTEAEQTALAGMPGELRVRASLQCWTGKEAYLKASGLGLSVSPADVDVVALLDEMLGLSVRGSAAQRGRWSLRAFEPGPGYVGAIAVEGRVAPNREIEDQLEGSIEGPTGQKAGSKGHCEPRGRSSGVTHDHSAPSRGAGHDGQRDPELNEAANPPHVLPGTQQASVVCRASRVLRVTISERTSTCGYVTIER